MLRPTIFRNNEFPVMSKFFEDFFEPMNLDSFAGSFKTDILDNGDHYLLQAELPGFTKEDIHLDLKDNYLTVSAKHEDKFDDEKDNYIRRERRYSSFSRTFNISDIDAKNIRAKYKDGILELRLPKRAEIEDDGYTIEIE